MPLPPLPTSQFDKIKEFLFGKPKSVTDKSIFHRLALIPFLAWIGLGSDGLSSSSYGPDEAFRTLGEHTYLAVLLVLMTATTVFVISACYSRIIEDFPHGGGGYVVASALLGRKAGVISGCALLVDYVLTITTSIAAGGDAVFSFLPPEWAASKLTVEFIVIICLTMLNLRGVKESVLVMAPIFVLFLITHLIGILAGVLLHLPQISETATQVHHGFQTGAGTMGWMAMLLLLVHAYSLGGGTYTGIEAVSNGLPIMREPKVYTAKRTMIYMAASLAFTASGLLLCYLLWHVAPVDNKTLNAVFFEKLVTVIPLGNGFVISALLAEGLLLIVAAQAGFIDGPRVLANMATDSWMPRRFAALSDRLTQSNGIVLMGGASLLALMYTRGHVEKLVVMYSINVFLTFSLSIFGMLKRHWHDRVSTRWFRDMLLFAGGFGLCATILVITVIEKFPEGGWITLMITSGLVLVCFWVKRHYIAVANDLRHLHVHFDDIVLPPPSPSVKQRTAVVLVGGYGNLGLHTVKNILRTFPGIYNNFIFVSVGVIDSGAFKGESEVDNLQQDTERSLQRYVDLVKQLGLSASLRYAVGTEVVQSGFEICREIAEERPGTTFFTGKLIFENEQWYQRFLHNETAFSLQKRIQLAGFTMVILPARVG